MDKLRAMELFVSIADTGSFSAAGRKHGLSPASVSRHVSALEEELGVALVLRSTRALGLTESGELYLHDVREILASLKAAETNATAQQNQVQGVLRVHSRTMFGISVLARLQPEFQEANPELIVDLHLSESPVRLREDQYDLDFRIAPPKEAGLVRRRLFHSRRILVATPRYIARAGAVEQPADLHEHACLTYWLNTEPVCWRFRRGEGEAATEINVPTSFMSNNGLVLLEMARAGKGIALLDEYTVTDDIRSGRLVEILPDIRVTNTTFDEGIFVTYLQTPYVPAKLRRYIDFVVDNWDRVRQGA
ncbi:LysR family transcriptional regulator [Sagittula sp. NFXS13]|uniref:LysR family transcriptional regulator n=1 Tax=Sagittula sp. NFXS13 TaxID=2819095 RepID=UPI0032E02773